VLTVEWLPPSDFDSTDWGEAKDRGALALKRLKRIIGEFDVKLNFSDGMMASERRGPAVLA
jgi:hypothetical protein